MKIFEVPTTLEDMSYSVSLTGITALKQSRYKVRHYGSSDVLQVPKSGFRLKRKEDKKLQPRPKKGIKLADRENQDTQPTKSDQQVRTYKINKKEVTHRIRNYVNQMKGEKMLYFWTITFPEKTKDDTAFLLMNKWLTRLRKERMIKEYLWITERQQNGTIHFHMVINKRMDVKKANKYMRASIMWSINSNEINYSREAAIRYNGVDLAKDRKTRRVINFAKQNKQKALTNYLSKYVTKNDESFTHLAWHSSREYSNLIISVRFTTREIAGSDIMNLVDQGSVLEGEYYYFYRWKGQPPEQLLIYLATINQAIQKLLLCKS